MADAERKSSINFEYANFGAMSDLASYPLSMWSGKPLNVPSAQQPGNFMRAESSLPSKQLPSLTSAPPVKMKRGHVSKACTNCRKMHAGCDHSRPCSRCVFHRMESTCIDVPRKKRISKKKKPEEGGESNSTPSLSNSEVEQQVTPNSIGAEKPKLQDSTTSLSSTNEKIWKDTFNELFGELASPQPTQFNPAVGYLQPLLFSEMMANEAEKVSAELASANNNNSNSNNTSSNNEPRRDMRDFVREMDELRRTNGLLETKLSSVTQELIEMRQKMQQMLQLLGGFFMPQNVPLGQLNEF